MWAFLKKFFGIWLGFLCTLITLSQFFLGTQTYIDFAEKYSLPTEISHEVSIIVAIIVTIVIFGIQLLLYFNDAKRTKLAGASIHRFNHEIRDKTFQIKAPDFCKKYKDHETFYRYIGNTCCELCEELSNFLKEKTGKKFSVCIKLLQSVDDNGNNKLCSFTLCRSGHDKTERKENGIKLKHGALNEQEIFIPVESNTAFNDILDDTYNEKKPSIFSCSNLLMLIILNFLFGKEKYKNPNKHFWKHYLSTIVVPIRINSRIVEYDFSGSNNEGYITIGFLCLDHRWPISRALKNELSEYNKGFADALFNLLYETRKCDTQIAIAEHETV